ncbi:MAG: hypothetical protein HY866_01650 [Chloroflexi bacterium]|nr:hypothetical protein [Chloroflexota bacterium]
MGEEEKLVQAEFRQLEGTNQRYFIYTFALHWRVEDLRAAMEPGRAIVTTQLADGEKVESIFYFSQTEKFDGVNLLGEMRRMLSDPLSERFSYSSIVGLSRLTLDLVNVIVSIGKRLYHDRVTVGFYLSLEEALAAMRERARTDQRS